MPVNRARYHFDNVYDEVHPAGPYLLHQVGDLSCEAGYEVPPHKQHVHELTYVVAGRGTCVTDGVRYPLEKGALFLNRIGETHAITSSDTEPLRYFYLGFRFREPVEDEDMRLLQAFFEGIKQHLLPDATGVQEPFLKLLSEIITRDALSDTLIACAMHQIIAYAFRLGSQRAYGVYGFDEARSADEKLAYDVLHFIDAEVERIVHLRSLCEVFGYSYTHIAQKFSALTGESLKTYYTKRRFEKAQEGIRRGLSVTAVAEMMGFQSIHAFSRAFKKQVGMTPRDFGKWAQEQRQSVP